MSYPTAAGQPDNCTPFREPRMCLGPTWASSYYQFYLTGTTTPANVYQDGALTMPFPSTGKVTSDAYGRFPAIYLDPSVTYRVRFFNSANVQQWQQDPYISQLSTVGTSSLSAFGFQIAPTGEVTLDAPNTGGTGSTLTLDSGSLGTVALKLQGTLAGNSALIVNSSATTGAQTATFSATNKPGTVGAQVTATAAPSGATYTGGNLTAGWAGASSSQYVITLSTGQNITGVSFANGSIAFTTPSTSITGTPTALISVGSTPSGWLPITCDGIQYYTPIWHGNSFTPYTANPAAIGEMISASTVTFGGSGQTTVTGGTATPPNWFLPATLGVGASYYINITRTGGTAGVNFSAAQGAWTNIGAGGLTISPSTTGTVTGTYQLSSSAGGTPVVASGTITLTTFLVSHIYTSGAGNETIPVGATTLTIEIYGGVSGGGGSSNGNGSGGNGGGGGGGPAYSKSVYTVTGAGGQTIAYAVGAAGAGGAGVYSGPASDGTAGGTSSVSSGTFALTTMTATAGGAGTHANGVVGGTGGAGGAATGGNTANTSGGAGGAGDSGNSPGAAGSYFTSPTYSSVPAAAGTNKGGALGGSGANGSTGVVSFHYT